MRGSIIKRTKKDGTTVWCIKYLDRDGKQRWETIGPNKRHAERVLADRLAQVNLGGGGSSETFGEFLPTWLASKGRSVRTTTLRDYEAHVRNHLIPYFGNMPMNRITLSVVQRFVDGWNGNPTTLRRVLATFSGIVKAAVVRDVMSPLDFGALQLPSEVQAEIHPLTREELHRLADCVNPRYRPDILFLGYTGVRRGEWIALPLTDCDLGSRTAWIRGSINRHGSLEPTKSGKTRRIVLFDEAVAALEARERPASCSLAFPSKTGHYIQANNFFSRIWTPATIKAGLPNRRIHDLRHTAATMMIEAGAPVQFVAQQLGHSDPSFTLRTYIHWFEHQNTRAANEVQAWLSSNPVADGSQTPSLSQSGEDYDSAALTN